MSASQGIARTLRVLRGAANPAANAVLAEAAHSDDEATRVAAVHALAERSDPEAQATLLDVYSDASSDARHEACKPEVAKRLRKAVLTAIKSDDVSIVKRACRFAIDADLFDALPTLIEQACDPDHPYGVGLATATMQLCRVMGDHIEHGTTVRGDDPAFYRTATLRQLISAAESFGKHGRLELVESLLLVTTRDNVDLLRMLRVDGHPCHDALTDTLAVSPSFGALDVLWHALVDSDSPQRLLEIASERTDKAFLVRLTDHVGYPIGVRTRENAGRVERFAWMSEQRRDAALGLDGQQQAVLLSLAAATAAPVRERFAFVRFLLDRADEAGRVAACHLLREFDIPEVVATLKELLDDDAPDVIAAALKQIRARNLPGAEMVLIDLLEHPAEQVRRAAQSELYELNLSAYRDLFARLSDPARRAAGRLVARADPEAADQLAADLRRPILRQRMEGLEMIDAMGLVDELSGPLTQALTDEDAGVRAEAARLLGVSTVRSESVQVALATAAADPVPAVRIAVEKSLEAFGAIDLAGKLIQELQDEFNIDSVDSDESPKETDQ